jgi:hypothetical protein
MPHYMSMRILEIRQLRLSDTLCIVESWNNSLFSDYFVGKLFYCMDECNYTTSICISSCKNKVFDTQKRSIQIYRMFNKNLKNK